MESCFRGSADSAADGASDAAGRVTAAAAGLGGGGMDAGTGTVDVDAACAAPPTGAGTGTGTDTGAAPPASPAAASPPVGGVSRGEAESARSTVGGADGALGFTPPSAGFTPPSAGFASAGGVASAVAVSRTGSRNRLPIPCKSPSNMLPRAAGAFAAPEVAVEVEAAAEGGVVADCGAADRAGGGALAGRSAAEASPLAVPGATAAASCAIRLAGSVHVDSLVFVLCQYLRPLLAVNSFHSPTRSGKSPPPAAGLAAAAALLGGLVPFPLARSAEAPAAASSAATGSAGTLSTPATFSLAARSAVARSAAAFSAAALSAAACSTTAFNGSVHVDSFVFALYQYGLPPLAET